MFSGTIYLDEVEEIEGGVTKGQGLYVDLQKGTTMIGLVTQDPETMEKVRFAAEVALREYQKLYGPEPDGL